jgi:hypothetical protein
MTKTMTKKTRKIAARTARATSASNGKADGTKLTFKQVARQVLHGRRTGLTAREIIALAVERGLYRPGTALTPQDSLKAQVSVDIARNGSRSVFIRVGRGKYLLRKGR